jgi:hypothetical protein
LVGGWSVLLPLTVSFTVLLLHRDVLRVRLRVMRSILPELSVEVGQLLVELAPGLDELIKACPALGVRGAMMRCRLRVGGVA